MRRKIAKLLIATASGALSSFLYGHTQKWNSFSDIELNGDTALSVMIGLSAGYCMGSAVEDVIEMMQQKTRVESEG